MSDDLRDTRYGDLRSHRVIRAPRLPTQRDALRLLGDFERRAVLSAARHPSGAMRTVEEITEGARAILPMLEWDEAIVAGLLRDLETRDFIEPDGNGGYRATVAMLMACEDDQITALISPLNGARWATGLMGLDG